MVVSYGHSKNSSLKERATNICHKVSQPARGPPGSVPHASVTHWEMRLVFAGVDPALRQWCYGPHGIENSLNPCLPTPAPHRTGVPCSGPQLSGPALEVVGERDWTRLGWNDGQAHGRDGVLEGLEVPSFALEPSAQLAPSAPSPPSYLLSLLIQQKAFYLFISSAVEPEDLDLLHFKCLFVF